MKVADEIEKIYADDVKPYYDMYVVMIVLNLSINNALVLQTFISLLESNVWQQRINSQLSEIT